MAERVRGGLSVGLAVAVWVVVAERVRRGLRVGLGVAVRVAVAEAVRVGVPVAVAVRGAGEGWLVPIPATRWSLQGGP